jgi:malonyl-CoA O-methyltransferase
MNAAPGSGFELDRRALRASFDRASRHYDASAVLQERVRSELLERLELIGIEPRLVIDLGCGTGHGAQRLKRRFRRARVMAVDLAPGMLREAKRHSRPFARFARVCADAARLPLADGSADLVFSSLMLQWCGEPDAVFREVQRVLRPGGFFAFSTFGPDTLRELRDAWRAADLYAHVNHFIDLHDIGSALSRAGLAEPVLDVERTSIDYPDAMTLMRDLKAIGAHNVNSGRSRGLTGRRALRRMLDAYEALRHEGTLPASYEIIFGAAWSGERAAGSPHAGSVTRIPVSAIGRRHGV